MLVLGHLVGERSGDGWFRPGEVAEAFDAIRVRRPHVSNALARLLEDELVVRRTTGGQWSLTPEGGERIRDLVGDLDVPAIEAEITRTGGGAELEQAQHPTIPAELAPVRFAVGIGRLLERFPFEQNVFCMTRFPKEEKEDEYPDPVRQVLSTARSVLEMHGLHLHLASDRAADDELFGNVAAHMWACKYGLGLFETRYGEEFNDNLQIEVGGMLMTGRRVALLKDRDTPDMPTDFVGHIYKSVDFEDIDDVAEALHLWAAEDLGLGRCRDCPRN